MTKSIRTHRTFNPQIAAITAVGFALLGVLLIFLTHASTTIGVTDYSQSKIYTSPDQPAFVGAFTGAWLNPDGSVGTAIGKATGPLPTNPPQSKDPNALAVSNIYLKSSPSGVFTPSVVNRTDSLKTASGKGIHPIAVSSQADITLKDGTLLRRVNGDDTAAFNNGVASLAGVPEANTYKTAFIQSLAPGATAWSQPNYLLDPATETYQISRIQYLRDGRLIATGQVWHAKAGTKNASTKLEALLMVSDDQGRSWNNGLVIPASEPCLFPNEWDAAEMPSGDLLAVFRSTALKSVGEACNGPHTAPVRNEVLLKKTGATWTMNGVKTMRKNSADASSPAFPHAGHPELISAKEGFNNPSFPQGIIIYFSYAGPDAGYGNYYTIDGGVKWTALPSFARSLYYPNSVQSPNGTIYVFDNQSAKGCGDCFFDRADTSSLTMFKFKLSVGGTPSSDTDDPTVNITAPTNNAQLSGSVTFNANAADNVGVTRVEYYSGATKLGEDTTAPYSYGWDTASVANGTTSLTAKAYDAAGHVATSTAVSVTINNPNNPTSSGGNYYVDKDSRGGACNDSRTAEQAKNLTSPWCSIEKALALTPTGGTIQVRAGSYPHLVVTNKTATSYITVQAYTSENPSLAGLDIVGSHFLRFKGFDLSATSSINGNSGDIQMIGNHSTTGVVLNHTKNVLIENNNLSKPGTVAGSDALDVYSSNDNVTIRGNTFNNVGGVHSLIIHAECLQLKLPSDPSCQANDHFARKVLIEDNLFIGAYAMNLRNIVGLTVNHNTAWNTSLSIGLRQDLKYPGSLLNATVTNNILQQVYTNAANATAYGEFKNNIIGPDTATRINYRGKNNANGPPATPIFVNAAALDYHLAPTSPGINGGTDGKNVGRLFATSGPVDPPPPPPPPPTDTDTQSPATNITAPVSDSTATGTVNVTANATDNVAVTKLELYIDDSLSATDIAAPYVFNWNTASLTNGSHSLTTKAYDAAGHVTTSAAVPVTVSNTPTGINPGDIDGNGTVDVFDLRVIGKNWGLSGRNRSQGDLNGDGTVNIFDLRLVGKNWGT